MFWKFYGILLGLFITIEPNVNLPYSFDGPFYNKDLNFGVISLGKMATYRSAKLGEDGLEKLYEHLGKVGLPKPKTIISMNKNGYGGYASFWQKNSIEEYEQSIVYDYFFFHAFDYDYRTYVDGDNPYFPNRDIDQSKWMNSKAKEYFGLIKDGKPDGDVDAVIRVMNIVLEPELQPVLFHCQGGRHRTGMIAMIIRHLQGGIWVDGATVKMKIEGKEYDLNPAEYEYYRHNKTQMRKANIDFVRTFVLSDDRFKVLKEKFQAIK